MDRLRIKDLPVSERPYEKLKLFGAESLSNAELLAIIIKTGTQEETAVQISQKLLKLDTLGQGLSFLNNISLNELVRIHGIGNVKAIQIKAVIEFAKRMSRPQSYDKVVIKSAKDVVDLVGNSMKYEKREILKEIILDSKNTVLKIYDVAIGGVNAASAKPRDVLVEPIKMQADGIILVHNHPSGNPEPSEADVLYTQNLYQVIENTGICFLDHVVIGSSSYFSMNEKHLMFNPSRLE